ncbi:MAG: spore coat U domain-containing protein [Bdellovibrionales bacterium]|nr:spore coat U domain-containing protein [Bdellovibrionales bacterium]
MKLKLILVVLFSLFANLVFADCDYALTTPVFSYSVGDSNPTVPGTITINRNKSGASACSNFFLAFTRGWAGNYNRRALNLLNGDLIYYNLYKNSNTTGVLKEPSDITSTNEVLFGTITKDETKSLTYYFTLAPISSSVPPRAGTYIDVIQVQAYSGLYTNINAYEGYRDLYVYINISKFVSLSLVDSGAVYDSAQTSKTLDFGELTQDEQMSFDVRILSNAGYILKVSSSNNGLLKRVDGTGSKSEIAYDFYASNSKKSLSSSASSPVTIASGTGRTPSGGAQIPIKVVIKSVDDKDPGTYQDYVTLSVISND